MISARQPAVAGTFYPADPEELQLTVDRFLAASTTTTHAPKAIIAPHAGYIYSGPIAASAYAQLAAARQTITTIVLLGPSHRIPFQGLAVSSATEFITPLGTIPVNLDATKKILSLPHVEIRDDAHAMEHSLEVHLPFLQCVLNQFSLLPLVVGDADPKSVSEVLDIVWGGPETLIVVSTDLSHYHDYDTARRMDRATSDAIEHLSPDAIHHDQACGRNPVNGLLYAARRRGLHAKTLDLRNSGDTAGPRDQVVGYGAYVLENNV